MWMKAQSELAGDCKSYAEMTQPRESGVTILETIEEQNSTRRLDNYICLWRIVDGSVNEKDSSTCRFLVCCKFTSNNKGCGCLYHLAHSNLSSDTYRTFVDCSSGS